MFERFLVRLFRGCAARPFVTLGVLLVLGLGSGEALRHMRFSDMMESFFAGASDEWAYYNELTRSFLTDQIVAVGLEPPGELFTAENLRLTRELSKKLEALDGAKSVTDLTSVNYFMEGQDRFSSEPLVPEEIPTDPESLARIQKRAMGEPLYVGGILSLDGRMESIQVRIADGLTSERRLALTAEIGRVVYETMANHPEWRVAITGEPWFTYYHQKYMVRDLNVLTPATALVLFIVMIIVLRRFVGALVALGGCLLFMLMAYALLVLTGGTMNGCTTMIPPFALIMAITIVIHFFNDVRLNTLRYKDRAAALDHTIKELSAPTYYANFSTAIGFFSLAVSSIPAILEFGVAMGLGMIAIVFVLMAFSSAVVRLIPPHLLISMDPHAAEQSLVVVRMFERLGAHLFKHRIAWISAIAVMSAVTLYGASQVRIETNTLEMFHESDRLYQDAVFYGKRFGGVSTLYIAIDSPQADYLKSPQALKDIENIEAFLAREINAGYSFSLTKFVKTMHKAFYDGDPAHYSIPESREQIAQLLLINTDEDINDVVNERYSKGVIIAWVNEHSTSKLLKMKERTDAYLQSLSHDGVNYRLSGTLMLDTELMDAVARSTFMSFILAMGIIFLLRLVQFRHFYLGLLSLLPNGFPIWTTFGMMGLLGIPLNVSTAMSATVTLGIADDETIHFFASYQALRKQGRPPREAIIQTLVDKGSSILFSTIVVTLGFSTLLFSDYGPTMWFGIVLTISFIVSIFANVVFAPALLDLTRPIRDPAPKASAQLPGSESDSRDAAPATLP